MQLDATQIFIFGTIWSAIVGSIGWIAGRWETKSDRKHAEIREKANRRTHFLRFLAAAKADIATMNPMNFSTLRSSQNEELRVESGVVRNDLPEMLRAEFERRISAVYLGGGEGAMEVEKYRKIWLGKMEELILFFEAS